MQSCKSLRVEIKLTLTHQKKKKDESFPLIIKSHFPLPSLHLFLLRTDPAIANSLHFCQGRKKRFNSRNRWPLMAVWRVGEGKAAQEPLLCLI